MKVAVSAHRALDKSQPFDSVRCPLTLTASIFVVAKLTHRLHPQNFAAFAEVDRLMQAMTTNHVANRASRAQVH
jgi:hypothetical protein